MIVPTTKAQLAVLLALAAAAPAVNAHGSMSLPKPTFAIQGDTTQFGLTVDSSALTAPSGMSFTTDPTSNTNAFTAALKASSYKTVKALVSAKGVPIAGANKECGITSATGAKQALPAQVEWSHGSGEGFTPSHEGPCEVWCDEELVFSDTNCAKNYPAAPAKLPYKKEKCAGKSVLKTVWLALHSPTWQAYINCAAIEGGSSSGGSGGSTTPSTTPKATSKTPSATTKKPSTTPKATSKAPATETPVDSDADEDCDDELPVAGDNDEDCDDELEIPDTPAPAAGGGEVGGEADGEVGGEGDDEDCEDELPVAGDNDDEDCEDELPVAGDNDDEDCDEELEVAGEAVRTSDLDFSSISAADKSGVGKVESY